MKSELDLASTSLDFASLHAKDPTAAMRELLILLLDPAACQSRRIMLEEAEALGREGPLREFEIRSAIATQRWDAIIDLVGRLGPGPALDAGSVSVADLDALTWNTEALERVHRLLCDFDEFPGEPPAGRRNGAAIERSSLAIAGHDTAAGAGETRLTLTRLAQRGDRGGLKQAIRPLAPELMRFLGWPLDRSGAVTAYLVARSSELADRRFRDAASDWLTAYAAEHGLVTPPPLDAAAWDRIALNASLDAVAAEYAARPHRPEWVDAFFARVQPGALTEPKQLLQTPLDELAAAPGDAAEFRARVYVSVDGEYKRLAKSLS